MSKRALDSGRTPSVGDEARNGDDPSAGVGSGTESQHRQKMAKLNPQLAARRRTTSCAACRKQKIKCELLADGPPCERCKRKNIECIINTGLRNSILDQRQIAALRRDLGNMHANLERVCQHLQITGPLPLETPAVSAEAGASHRGPDNDFDVDDEGLAELSPPGSPSAVQAPMDAYLAPSKAEATPTGPAQASNASRPRAQKRPDIISKGIISPEDADALVRYYQTELDSVIYGLAGLHSTVSAVREASPTLLAVICTVAALHDVEHAHLYEVCYREFRHLVSTALFEKRDIEHVRALDVAAFWLPDTSRVVLYEAVRRLGDLRVHRHIGKACTPPDDGSLATAGHQLTRDGARDRVRLWYTLYMCDQHLSVLYNRDSLIRRHKDIIDKRGVFLAAEDATMHDLRIVAQVTLLLCMSRMKETFGSEYPTRVPEALAPQIPVFVDELDQWLAHFPPQFRQEPGMGEFPVFAFKLHYLFARLYLGHHVFRGLHSGLIPEIFLPAAAMAQEASLAIFNMILTESVLLRTLVKVPSYVHIMISFAGHFLLELCLKHREQLGINVEESYRCLTRTVSLLRETPMTRHHPLSRVTDGLAKRLVDFAAAYGKEVLTESPESRFVSRQSSNELPFSAPFVNAPGQTGPVFDLESAVMPDEFTYADYGDVGFPAALPDFTMKYD
ncbi:C6 transcription factor [Purpureocillium lavendulum]|uniref:C6 transcription factor n=1 Tax=Purpureocillium lavendulum TaxID=1247861 RepID=A0AB34FJA4_9HYPO|nr:C6 transcription factor [Purpureocillium lavendulum]